MKHIRRSGLFDRQVRRLLTKLGAKSDPTRGVPWSCYSLETEAGRLDLSVHTSLDIARKDWTDGGGSPWVTTGFDDVKAASALHRASYLINGDAWGLEPGEQATVKSKRYVLRCDPQTQARERAWRADQWVNASGHRRHGPEPRGTRGQWQARSRGHRG